MNRTVLSVLAWIGATTLLAPLFSAPVDGVDVIFRRLQDRVRVEIGGQLFTEYVFHGAPKPYLFPVVAADGTELTRGFPMRPAAAGENADHPHHRSLWFGHGKVNGFDFWKETGTKAGKIVNESVEHANGAGTGTIRSRNRWVGPDGVLLLTDETRLRIEPLANGGRYLDYDITLEAPAEKPVVFGDTKEGAMAIRLAPWFTLPHADAKTPRAGGAIVNAGGARDDEAWGKRAAWVDFHGSKDAQVYGVAVFDHPQNPRYPTWWHVRDYGLFAANPFGRHDFEGTREAPLPANTGDLTIPAGGRATFRWRFYFHFGDEKAAAVAQHARDYAAGK